MYKNKKGWIIIALIFLIAIAGGIAYYNNQKKSNENQQPPKQEENKNQSQNNYGIFGNDKFETKVDGYLEVKQQEINETIVPVAYLVITKFYEDGFKNSVEKGISQGNGVNLKENNVYKFNLGCYNDGKIEGTKYDDASTYIDDETQKKIISSSIDKPISVILSFGYHIGTGCVCCNLAHNIKTY